MSNNKLKPSNFFNPDTQLAELCLIACPGAEALASLIDKHLVKWAKEVGMEKETFLIEGVCPRFQSGDAKGLVKSSVRGDDIYFICDPGNYSLPYPERRRQGSGEAVRPRRRRFLCCRSRQLQPDLQPVRP